jgi:hypothetical protein
MAEDPARPASAAPTPDRGTGPIDRDLQRKLLMELRGIYPNWLFPFQSGPSVEVDTKIANLAYLKEHGLCQFTIPNPLGDNLRVCGAKITARGLDFLADDGGLSAILGVVTIKVHADTIRDLIAAKIDASNASEAEKSSLKARLRKLPGAALQAATTELAKLGLEHMPDAVHWLQSLGGIL